MVSQALAWLDLARPVTMAELAILYSALGRHPAAADAGVVPAVVFCGLSGDAPPAPVQRLRQFGVTVWSAVSGEAARTADHQAPSPAVPLNLSSAELTALGAPTIAGEARGGRIAYLLGGTLHGWCVPDTAQAEEGQYVAMVADLVERQRLAEWAETACVATSCACDYSTASETHAVFSRMHKPGSDSRGVVQFRLGAGEPQGEVVAKIGAWDVIVAEVRFTTRVNALLAEENRQAIFPAVHGVRIDGNQAISLMEAGEPMPIAPLFVDPERTTLGDDALNMLEPHLDQLAAWYRITAQRQRPTVADYLYRERYQVLRGNPDFVSTFGTFFPNLDLADLLDLPVGLPEGLTVPGYTAAVRWLDEVVPALLPDHGSAVHGDIYAANMLLRHDGAPLFIDPRTVWEGRDRPDIGYGDPVYDLATLLHGVWPMAAILRAAETGTTPELFALPVSGPVAETRTALDLAALTLPMRCPSAVGKLEERMLAMLPVAEESRVVRTRLYIGAATSLAGWLKYAKSLRTPEAWLATYAFVLWYLARARDVWNNEPHSGEGGK